MKYLIIILGATILGSLSLENLCTKKYAEFKMDAMGIEFDYGLTEKEFKRKWQGKYNLDLVNQESFLLGTQDHGKIKVSSVIPKSIETNGAWYNVTLKDLDFNNTVNREIRIVKNGKRYLIDEVLEDGYSNF